jgi:hypothetical protein
MVQELSKEVKCLKKLTNQEASTNELHTPTPVTQQSGQTNLSYEDNFPPISPPSAPLTRARRKILNQKS